MTHVRRAVFVAIGLALIGCDRRDVSRSASASGARPVPAPAATTGASSGTLPATTAPTGPNAKRAVRPPTMVAKTDVSTLVSAVKMFAADVGRFPTAEEGLDAISNPPPGVTGWHGPYVRNDVNKLRDPWGNAYRYRSPGVHNPKAVDVFSLGPDGKEGVDDIGNW